MYVLEPVLYPGKIIVHLDILMALPINDGSLSDFYMVYQFIDHSTVQVLQIQIWR